MLIVDLPVEESAPAVPASPTSSGRGRAERVRKHVLSYVLVMLFLVAIWAVTGAGYFWPIWPILGWGLGLAFDVLGLERSGHYGRRSARRREMRERGIDRRDQRLGRDDDEEL